MTQEATTAKATSLHEVHRKAGATFASSDGWEIPGVYSSVAEEYRALRKGIALADRSHWGRLRIRGKDALDLLNRLSTNSLMELDRGQGATTVLTSSKGRIIDLLLIVNLGDELLVITSPQTLDRVIEWLDFYTFDEDISVEDVTEETAMLSLMGPGAVQLLGGQAVALELPNASHVSVQDIGVTAISTDAYGIAWYDLLVPASQAGAVWEALCQSGAVPVGEEALEVLRVEQGVPRYGRELSEEFNPLEAGMLSSISFEKGCYIGQEVVLRLKTYNKVQKHLMGIALGDADVSPGARLEVDGKNAGLITSVVDSPLLGQRLALGYVRTAYASAGQQVDVKDGDLAAVGRVTDLPVRGG
ncbi:MAG: aminomethyl transferase family protein [Chloroflexi bacterium]|nr:aminomethyl transferase family protein [Chloroflexota bacterium]